MSRRVLLVLLLLGALLTLPPIAHASPTDPTWIPGLYDDNDYDDAVLFITGAVTVVDSLGADPVGPVTAHLGLIVPRGPLSSSAQPLDSLSTRAPPLPLS